MRHQLAGYTPTSDLFQSTHSQGVRRITVYSNPKKTRISIHALTRSATSCFSQNSPAAPHFNPRTHKECDRPPRPLSLVWGHFNPRTHKECDDYIAHEWVDTSSISIHALTRSATCDYSL